MCRSRWLAPFAIPRLQSVGSPRAAEGQPAAQPSVCRATHTLHVCGHHDARSIAPHTMQYPCLCGIARGWKHAPPSSSPGRRVPLQARMCALRLSAFERLALAAMQAAARALDGLLGLQCHPRGVLADDDGDRRGRHYAGLGDDHREVLHRRHVVHEVEQLEARHVAPLGHLGTVALSGHEVVGVAQLVVADGIEEHALGKLVGLAANEHRHAALVGEHRHQRSAGASDERAVEQHRRGTEQHLAHLWHDVREGVQVGIGAAQPRIEQAAQHGLALQLGAAVGDDDAERDALAVCVE
mmetsp:Transcript_3145/g.8127  ORF Transcript_3145/g.8127 Transcript_3145/m.8127 type:complete len:297 (-) Transcript_3145:612-1502(-)